MRKWAERLIAESKKPATIADAWFWLCMAPLGLFVASLLIFKVLA